VQREQISGGISLGCSFLICYIQAFTRIYHCSVSFNAWLW